MNALLQAVRSVDLRIYYSLSCFADNRDLCRLARLEEGNNLLKGGIFFALFWGQWFRREADQEKRRRAIVAILIGAVLAIIASRTVAFIVPFRIRPMDDPTIIHPVYSVHFEYNLIHWSSFPSDTAAYFFALAFGLAYLSRRIAIPILLYTAGWVCLTRMFLGVHYASDIAVGLVIGLAMVWLSIRSDLVQLHLVQPAVTVMNTGRSWFYPMAFLVSFEMATVFEGLRSLGNAVIHAAASGLHLGSVRTNLNRPIGVWGGLVVTVALLVAAFYVSSVLSTKIRAVPGISHNLAGHFHLPRPASVRAKQDGPDKPQLAETPKWPHQRLDKRLAQ
jgi:undecaprenyl-diphosphatase